jgi:CheY-like chemotaxis protein
MAQILLVEDNDLNREMLTRRLQRKGFTVVHATNGAEALAVVYANPPDLVLMDMSLPVMSGWEATRLLKQDKLTAHIPVIALTAHALSSDRDQALAAGCEDFETKPIELLRLVAKMEELLVRSKAATPNHQHHSVN